MCSEDKFNINLAHAFESVGLILIEQFPLLEHSLLDSTDIWRAVI